MTKTSKKLLPILGVVGAALVAVLVLVAVRRPAPAVPVVDMRREDVSQTIASNGTIEPIDPMIARAQFPAFVSKVAASEGQSVRRGQLILTLDASDIEAQLAAAKGDLIAARSGLRDALAGGPPADAAQLQANLIQAKADVTDFDRKVKSATQLLASQAVTQDELAQDKTALEKAQARWKALQDQQAAMKQQAASDVERMKLRMQQDEEQVNSLRANVDSATVRAAEDGVLYSLPAREGDYVKVGDELGEVADLRKMRVRVYVDEPEMGALAPGETVQVTWDALPGRVWTGKTEQAPKQVVKNGMRNVAEQVCSVDNDKLELLPNINVNVRILVHQSKNALVVPRGAVRDDNGQRFVFVFDGNDVKRRNVTLGVANASDYEVLSGLSVGDRVAVPQDRVLHDGMNVRATEGN